MAGRMSRRFPYHRMGSVWYDVQKAMDTLDCSFGSEVREDTQAIRSIMERMNEAFWSRRDADGRRLDGAQQCPECGGLLEGPGHSPAPRMKRLYHEHCARDAASRIEQDRLIKKARG